MFCKQGWERKRTYVDKREEKTENRRERETGKKEKRETRNKTAENIET